MNRIEQYLPTPQVLLAFSVSFIVLLTLAAPVFSDADTLWHIAAGDFIRELGAIPDHDPWSFTAGNQPWYNISWLFDIGLSLLHAGGGIKAIYLFPPLLLSLLIAFLIRHILQRKAVNSDVIIMLALCMAVGFASFATARPQIIAMLLAAITHQILHSSRDKNTYGALCWLPVIFCIWANVHGSFVVGMSLLGAYGLEAIIHKKWGWFKRLLFVGMACSLALLINPYGFGIISAMNRTLDSAITKFIQEWLPFVFGNFMGLSVWVLLFIAAGNFRENAIPIADKIIAAIWFVFMLFSMRHAAMFMVVSAPYLAISMQKSIDALEAIVTKHPDPLAGLQKPGRRMVLAVIALLLPICVYAGLEPLKGEEYLAAKDTDPTPAIRYVEEHYAGKRFLNDYALGGHQIYLARGRVPLFIDGRSGTVYSEAVLMEYIDFLWLNKGWEKIINSYKIEGMLLLNNHNFAKAYEAGQYHDQWKEVYRDMAASVYIKK